MLAPKTPRNDGVEQDVRGSFVEIVKVDVQRIAEERCVQTYVEGLGAFPGERFVTHREHQARDGAPVESVGIGPDSVGRHEVVQTHILLVAVDTVRGAELQVSDLVVVVAHELLLGDAPSDRHGREETSVPFLEEFRRHVVTGREFDVVFIVVGVADTAEVGLQGRPRIVLRGERCAAVARDGTLAGLVQVVEVCLRGVDRVVFFRLLRPADQCGYVVFLGERAVEVQQDLPVEIGVSSDPVVGGGGGASGEYGGRGVGPVCTVVGDHVVGHVVGEAVLSVRDSALSTPRIFRPLIISNSALKMPLR